MDSWLSSVLCSITTLLYKKLALFLEFRLAQILLGSFSNQPSLFCITTKVQRLCCWIWKPPALNSTSCRWSSHHSLIRRSHSVWGRFINRLILHFEVWFLGKSFTILKKIMIKARLKTSLKVLRNLFLIRIGFKIVTSKKEGKMKT